jgi:hypothetical protein
MMFKKLIMLIMSFWLLGLADQKGDFMLVLDEDFSFEIPRNFRTTADPFLKQSEIAKLPSRLGLPELKAVTSAQFSEKTLKNALKKIPGEVRIIDLRRESHGFVNGIPISWYYYRNDSNAGLRGKAIIVEERALLDGLRSHIPLTLQRITSKSGGVIHSTEPFDVNIQSLETEQQLTQRLGLAYSRLPVLDHNRPDDVVVDEFIDLVKDLSPNTWLYFHCRAGKGRSTTFMALYDILHNGRSVSLEDIVLRQKLIGGSSLLHVSHKASSLWKEAVLSERKAFLETFYRYATDKNGYPQKSWTEWLKASPG